MTACRAKFAFSQDNKPTSQYPCEHCLLYIPSLHPRQITRQTYVSRFVLVALSRIRFSNILRVMSLHYNLYNIHNGIVYQACDFL